MRFLRRLLITVRRSATTLLWRWRDYVMVMTALTGTAIVIALRG